MKKFAVIDVGSNSVRLMLVVDGNVLYKRLQTTRLGEGLATAPLLKEEAITRTVKAIADFYGQAKVEGAESTFVFATAAVRSAENREIFLESVEKLCGLTVEVISGEEEAEIGLLGALGNGDGAIVDIGGASTEIVVKKQGEIVYKKSVNVGVVRLKDEFGRDIDGLKNGAKIACRQFGQVPTDTVFYGIGGTATTLAAQYLRLEKYDGQRVTGTTVSLSDLQELLNKLSAMTVEEIAALPCMPTGRADVILGGLVWLVTLMEELGITTLTVSDKDNLEGYAVKKGLME